MYISFSFSVCYAHCVLMSVCWLSVCVNEWIFDRALSVVKETSMWWRLITCVILHGMLSFLSTRLLFVNKPWMTIMSTIQISHATFVFLFLSSFFYTIVINWALLYSLLKTKTKSYFTFPIISRFARIIIIIHCYHFILAIFFSFFFFPRHYPVWG